MILQNAKVTCQFWECAFQGGQDFTKLLMSVDCSQGKGIIKCRVVTLNQLDKEELPFVTVTEEACYLLSSGREHRETLFVTVKCLNLQGPQTV